MTAEPVEHGNAMLAHRGPWSEADYLALPEQQAQRVELIDGELLVTPHGDGEHQLLGARLWRELDRQLPDHLVALHEANVRLRTGRLVIPDLVITSDLSGSLVYDRSTVVLTGEIVSPWGQARDRILKPAMNAESGIAWYLLVERDPALELILHRLDGGGYVEDQRALEGERIEIADLAVTIEVDALLRRR
jgi:Uma2 family endonuclease